MVDATEIRMGLLRRRVSVGAFAVQCGLSVNELNEEFASGELSDAVLAAYESLDDNGVGQKQVEELPKKEVELPEEGRWRRLLACLVALVAMIASRLWYFRMGAEMA